MLIIKKKIRIKKKSLLFTLRRISISPLYFFFFLFSPHTCYMNEKTGMKTSSPRVFQTYNTHPCTNMVTEWKSLHFTNANKILKIQKQ